MARASELCYWVRMPRPPDESMIDYDPRGWRFGWPPASFRQWLVGLGSFAALVTALYFLFSALGW